MRPFPDAPITATEFAKLTEERDRLRDENRMLQEELRARAEHFARNFPHVGKIGRVLMVDGDLSTHMRFRVEMREDGTLDILIEPPASPV